MEYVETVDQTYRFWRDKLVKLDGRLGPICAFFTSDKDVTLRRDEKRLLGRAVIAVDSRSRDVRDVRLVKADGNDPARRNRISISH